MFNIYQHNMTPNYFSLSQDSAFCEHWVARWSFRHIHDSPGGAIVPLRAHCVERLERAARGPAPI